jgi:hypothetical protein
LCSIEFLNIASERELAVCKFNKYFHRKNHTRPPKPPALSSLQQFLLAQGEISMSFEVGDLLGDGPYCDIEGKLRIPKEREYQWTHSDIPEGDDSRSTLLRWLQDNSVQVLPSG